MSGMGNNDILNPKDPKEVEEYLRNEIDRLEATIRLLEESRALWMETCAQKSNEKVEAIWEAQRAQALAHGGSAALWRAYQMLSAINDSDPSADRRAAALDAFKASTHITLQLKKATIQ